MQMWGGSVSTFEKVFDGKVFDFFDDETHTSSSLVSSSSSEFSPDDEISQWQLPEIDIDDLDLESPLAWDQGGTYELESPPSKEDTSKALKDIIRCKIQLERINTGQEELKADFTPREYQETYDEVRRRNAIKERNKQHAWKSRAKFQKTLESLRERNKLLMETNNDLLKSVFDLEASDSELSRTLAELELVRDSAEKSRNFARRSRRRSDHPNPLRNKLYQEHSFKEKSQIAISDQHPGSSSFNSLTSTTAERYVSNYLRCLTPSWKPIPDSKESETFPASTQPMGFNTLRSGMKKGNAGITSLASHRNGWESPHSSKATVVKSLKSEEHVPRSADLKPTSYCLKSAVNRSHLIAEMERDVQLLTRESRTTGHTVHSRPKIVSWSKKPHTHPLCHVFRPIAHTIEQSSNLSDRSTDVMSPCFFLSSDTWSNHLAVFLSDEETPLSQEPKVYDTDNSNLKHLTQRKLSLSRSEHQVKSHPKLRKSMKVTHPSQTLEKRQTNPFLQADSMKVDNSKFSVLFFKKCPPHKTKNDKNLSNSKSRHTSSSRMCRVGSVGALSTGQFHQHRNVHGDVFASETFVYPASRRSLHGRSSPKWFCEDPGITPEISSDAYPPRHNNYQVNVETTSPSSCSSSVSPKEAAPEENTMLCAGVNNGTEGEIPSDESEEAMFEDIAQEQNGLKYASADPSLASITEIHESDLTKGKDTDSLCSNDSFPSFDTMENNDTLPISLAVEAFS